MRILQPDKVYVNPPKLASMNIHLLKRDIIRISIFRVDNFGAEQHTYKFDQDYKVRVRVANPQRGHRCSITAEMILRRQPTLYSPINARSFQKVLRSKHFYNTTVQGPNRQLKPLTLRYNASWFAEPSSFLLKL